MPRRTYGRHRPRIKPAGTAGLDSLRADLQRTRTATCVECGLSLPPGWPHPQHARCRPERTAP